MTADHHAPPHHPGDLAAGRGFHPADFPPDRLAAARRRAGTSVSVVVPARDEETTVGGVVAGLRRLGMGGSSLVDEILVVDGGSKDATPAVAAEAGARVLAQADILPGAGDAPGKGEALWKGLAATDGDLVVFVDADLTGVPEGLLCGLLGPLLSAPGIAFVKAAYERPLRLGSREHEGEGGRVTELMARPLIATFWPELSGLVQPLAGECAGRRSVLERLPFVRGYGVELAMLVDLLDEVGAEAIAQVDLGRRAHDHQSLAALGRMATEILHVALARLQAAGRLDSDEPLGRRLRQPVRRPDGTWGTAVARIQPGQRPPLTEWRGSRDG